jgi:hypothetical protein
VLRIEEHTTMKLRCESGCKSSLADHPHEQQHQNFVTNTSTAYTQPIQHKEPQPMTWRLIELEVHHLSSKYITAHHPSLGCSSHVRLRAGLTVEVQYPTGVIQLSLKKMVIARRYPLLFFLELLDPTSIVASGVISWLLGSLLSLIPSSTKL